MKCPWVNLARASRPILRQKEMRIQIAVCFFDVQLSASARAVGTGLTRTTRARYVSGRAVAIVIGPPFVGCRRILAESMTGKAQP
jgi:hypothetical protein